MKKVLFVMLVVLVSVGIVFANGSVETEKVVEKVVENIDDYTQWPTLKFLNFNISSDLNSTKELADIEAATGIKAKYEILPSENASQVLMLNLSMGNDYDAVVIKTAGDFRVLISNGALVALNEYIDDYAPELWDLCSAEVWKGVSDENGNVYALPATGSVAYENTQNLAVRLDLAEKAGLGRELPKTATEFYNYCKALKDFYGDEYIILAGGNASGTFGVTKAIMSAFGITNDWMIDENGKVIYMTEHKNFKAMMDYMNKLYNEGILDVDYAINDKSKVTTKYSSGKAIITMIGRAEISTPQKTLEKKGVTLDDIGVIPYLADDEGNASLLLAQGYSVFTFIPKGAEDNAKYVVRYALEKVKHQEYCFIGTEGVDWYYDENGIPTPILPAFNDDRNLANNFLIMKDNAAWEKQFQARLKKTNSIWHFFEASSIDINNNHPEVWVESTFAFNNCPAYQTYNANLTNNLKTFCIQVVTCVKTLSASLSDFTKEFNAAGGEEVRAQLQAYYDAK